MTVLPPATSEPLVWADAEMLVRPTSHGRTRPLIVRVRTDDGAPLECVVKLSARLTMPPVEYLFEWLAAAIGRALGVNVPAPLAVRISADFASVIEDRGIAADAASSVGVAYGSTVATDYTQIVEGFTLSTILREDATRVLAFDAFLHNADRRRTNHNLFVQRERFLAFDHEQAFSFMLPILFAPDPVEDDCADIIAQHVLTPLLRGAMPGLDEFQARLATLDDAFFQAVRAATPSEWTGGAAVGKIDKVIEVLQRRRDTAARWLPRVQARVTA